MGTQVKERGGGPATALGSDIVGFLQQGLNTGTFGSRVPDASGVMGSTVGMAGVLNDILAGGAGHIGGSMMDMISKDTQRQVDASRARYSLGGTGYGTPGMIAESMLRSEQAPKLTSAIGNMQMSALLPLLQMTMQLGSKGITQRESFAQPSALGQIASLALPVAGTILGGPMGASIGSSLGGLFGMGGGGLTLPNAGPTPFAGFDMPIPQLFGS